MVALQERFLKLEPHPQKVKKDNPQAPIHYFGYDPLQERKMRLPTGNEPANTIAAENSTAADLTLWADHNSLPPSEETLRQPDKFVPPRWISDSNFTKQDIEVHLDDQQLTEEYIAASLQFINTPGIKKMFEPDEKFIPLQLITSSQKEIDNQHVTSATYLALHQDAISENVFPALTTYVEVNGKSKQEFDQKRFFLAFAPLNNLAREIVYIINSKRTPRVTRKEKLGILFKENPTLHKVFVRIIRELPTDYPVEFYKTSTGMGFLHYIAIYPETLKINDELREPYMTGISRTIYTHASSNLPNNIEPLLSGDELIFQVKDPEKQQRLITLHNRRSLSDGLAFMRKAIQGNNDLV